MEVKAISKFIRRGPRKIRPIADIVRGKMVQAALDYLKFERKVGAIDITKLIRSAVANASQKPGVNVDTLYVKTIMVDQGPTLKRFSPRARGSADKILKPMSHITVILDEKI